MKSYSYLEQQVDEREGLGMKLCLWSSLVRSLHAAWVSFKCSALCSAKNVQLKWAGDPELLITVNVYVYANYAMQS